jgi:hypothetical protein
MFTPRVRCRFHALVHPRLAMLVALLGVAVAASPSASAPGRGATARDRTGVMNYDVRVQGHALLDAVARGYDAASVEGMRRRGLDWERGFAARLADLRAAVPGAVIDRSLLTGGPDVIRSDRGVLAGTVRGRGDAALARGFLRRHAGAVGMTPRQIDAMRILGESGGGRSGLRMVRLQQRIHGAPVFQGDLRAVFDRQGGLVRVVGRVVPAIDESLVPKATGLMGADAALVAALRTLGLEVHPGGLRVVPAAAGGRVAGPAEVLVEADDERIARPVPSWRVYFPLGPGVAVPAWAQVVRTSGPGAWYTVVDGRTGTLLYRKNLLARASTQEARFSVYARADGRPADNPAPGSPNSLLPGSGTQFPSISRRIVGMLARQDPVASPDGWIPDGGDTTTGNNADVYLSRHSFLGPDIGSLDRDGRPVGNPDAFGRNRDFLGSTPRDFSYAPAPLGSDPAAGDDPNTAPFQRGALTHAFYLANHYHDLMYAFGWDEASGNMQADNFGRGGLGGDPVDVALQYDADFDYGEDAFAICEPDGLSPLAAFAIFHSAEPERETALEAETVLHELTHHLTCRLIGDAAGLNWGPGGGLAEGWSDFYAQAILFDRPGDDPVLQYAASPYIMYGADLNRMPANTFTDNYVYGIRRFPTTTDNSINPLTWADADPVTYDMSGGFPPSPYRWEDFGASEFHNLGEIWAVTLWEARARIIAAHGGDVAAGNAATLQVVTDALKLTPLDPTIVEARDAILDADCAGSGCAHEEAIWAGFADRGLGYGAHASRAIATRVGVRESFAPPFLDPVAVSVSDPAGNGNGHLDPGETVALTVTLLNPWRSAARGIAGATATLSTAEAGITILDGTATYGAIPARGTAAGEPFQIRLDAGAACGRRLSFEIETVSSLGTTRAPVSIRIGRRSGTGVPVTFSRAVPGGAPIPNLPVGVADALSVGADLEIADVNLRIDDLRHTAVGDLTVMLRSPDGLGGDLIWLLSTCSQGVCNPGTNTGDDFLGTVLDDGAKRDLYTAGTRKAPFTGSWYPVFNSRKFFLGTDPSAHLAGLNGAGTAGDWHLFVADLFRADVGTLNAWSLQVTPAAFTCGP